MKARILCALLVLAVSAMCAWFWLRHSASVPAAPMERETRAPAVELLEAPRIPSSAEGARSAPPATEMISPEGTIVLRVLDTASGGGVPDAEVFTLEWNGGGEEYRLRHGERGALGDWLEQHGRPARTDAAGEARVPRAALDASAFVRHGDAWALADYVAGDERVVLVLEPERALEVHVASSTGADAGGIDVVLRSLENWGLQFHSITDARGIARFRHLRPFQRRDLREACEVTLQGLFAHPPVLDFPAVMELAPRVELVLPPCGALDVELLGADGALALGPCGFEFQLWNSSEFFSHVFTSAPSGRIRVAPVELGLELHLRGGAVASRSSARLRARGPTRVDEILPVSLRLAEPAFVRYRAVDESGGVLANETLSCVLRAFESEDDRQFDSDPRPEELVRTDEAGRFHLPFLFEHAAIDAHITFDFLTAPRADGSKLFFCTEQSGTPPSASVDRGDAVFRSAELLMAGRVVDETGAPSADAQLRVYLPRDEFEEERSDLPEDAIAWAKSDAQGGFEVHGQGTTERVRVVANLGKPNQSPFVEVERGARDVILRVTRLGSLDGSLLLPDGVLPGDVRLAWTDARAKAGEAEAKTEPAHEGAEPGLARFHFAQLCAGMGELRIIVGSEEVAHFPDVRIEATRAARDPRLQRIDLRERIRDLAVAVVEPEGAPVIGGTVRVRRDSRVPLRENQRQHSWFIVEGVARCAVPVGPVDLSVEVAGFRRATLLGVDAREVRVRLQPLYEISVTIRGLDPTSGTLGTFAAPLERPVPCLEPKPAPEGTSMQFHSASAGMARVRLMRKSGEMIGEWGIEIADTELPQVFFLDVDPRLLK